MNVCIRNTFISLWLVFGTVGLSAQGASFYFPHINNAAPGSIQWMQLKVLNLDSVVSMQMVVRWNPKVLQYIGTSNFNFSDLNLSNFNTTRAVDSGYVRIQWEGGSAAPGFSVPDSTSIFRMKFKVIGPDSSSSLVNLTEILDFPPTYFEIVKVRADNSNEDYLLPECPVTKGFIAVGFTPVSISEIASREIPISLSPNPFLVSAQLSFNLAEAFDTQVFITDMMGNIVFQKNFFELQPGQHGMVIENNMLGAPGVYSLTLQAGRKIVTRKLVTF